MAKRKRSRRPSGHPAAVAARRERDAGRRASRSRGINDIARQALREIAELTDALDAELWASHLLGMLWSRRRSLPLAEATSPDLALIIGEPLIEAIARLGGMDAVAALRAIETVDDDALGARAGELADRAALGAAAGQPEPVWLNDLGTAEITGAAELTDMVFGDASTVFLEARHPEGELHCVGVQINHTLGGLATDILLADSIDRVAEVMGANPDPGKALRLDRFAPGVAAGRIHDAIELTDMTLGAPETEDYTQLRALALLRADETPAYVPFAGRPEMPQDERDRLRDEFLAAPEGQAFAPDGDDAYVVLLAIDFSADYVDGQPLRWSPFVVECFMADWIPRKVLADGELFEHVPAALDAWVRFAGRKRGAPESAVAETRQAIEICRDEMLERGSDPAVFGPAKQILAAAEASGVDVDNAGALGTFIKGWNARSEAR